MKRFFIIAAFAFLVLGIEINAVLGDTSGSWNRSDSWNITVKTGPAPPTIPLDSTGLLSLQNFSVSALATISDETFNASISELSFFANVSAEDEVSGQNINITMPTTFINGAAYGNETIITYICIDGKGNGYTLTQTNDSCVLSFYLYEGTHTVSLDICLDPPVSTLPELSPIGFQVVLAALFTLFAARLGFERRKRRYNDG